MRRPLKKKNELRPDHKYGSLHVAQFINYVMRDGKKSVAEKVVYDAFDEIKEKTKEDPVVIFDTAILNVGPSMEVRSRRVGGANYQIPYEARPERKLALAMRWIIEATRGKSGTSMSHKLAQELIAGSNNEGEAMKKKENVHRMAEANKAFAHFAFTGKRKRKKTA